MLEMNSRPWYSPHKIGQWTTALAAAFLACLLIELALHIYAWRPLPGTYEGKRHFTVPGGNVECMNPTVSRTYFSRPGDLYPGCVFYSRNRFSFRNSAAGGRARSQGTRRLIAIGDSFTYGFGVREEDTFPIKLEKKWRAEGRKVEVWNAAEPGAGLNRYMEILTKRALPLKPDSVLVGINMNDVMSFPTSLLIEGIAERFSWGARRYSRLLDFSLYVLERRLSSWENLRSMRDSFTPSREVEFRAFVKEVKELTQASGTEIFFVLYPVFFDFRHYSFTDVHRKLSDILREEQVRYLDFLPAFAQENAEDFWITKNDQHPNEKAHAIFFELLEKQWK